MEASFSLDRFIFPTNKEERGLMIIFVIRRVFRPFVVSFCKREMSFITNNMVDSCDRLITLRQFRLTTSQCPYIYKRISMTFVSLVCVLTRPNVENFRTRLQVSRRAAKGAKFRKDMHFPIGNM